MNADWKIVPVEEEFMREEIAVEYLCDGTVPRMEECMWEEIEVMKQCI